MLPLPASSRNLAAFLAVGRDRQLGYGGDARFLHRAASLPPLPTLPKFSKSWPASAETPYQERKRAATLAELCELLTPIPGDLRPHVAANRRRPRPAALRTRRHSAESSRAHRPEVRTDVERSKVSQTDAVLVPLPYRRTQLCPMREFHAGPEAAAIDDGPVSASSGCRPRPTRTGHLPCRVSPNALTPRSITRIVQDRAGKAGFRRSDFNGQSLMGGELISGMVAGAHPARLKRLDPHISAVCSPIGPLSPSFLL